MAETLLKYFCANLPSDINELLSPQIKSVEQGSFQKLLETSYVKDLLFESKDDCSISEIPKFSSTAWTEFVRLRVETVLENDETKLNDSQKKSPGYLRNILFLVGLSALEAFLQSNVTGPPLPFSPTETLFSECISSSAKKLSQVRNSLIESLGVDGETVYKLTPNLELFSVAQIIFSSPQVLQTVKAATWARVRTNFIHQRLLSDNSPSLQNAIYSDLRLVRRDLEQDVSTEPSYMVAFLLECATIHIHHGLDKLARDEIERATELQQFQFSLTGILGKRTKFQQKDTSQLVVLARSAVEFTGHGEESIPSAGPNGAGLKPKVLDLNDDTLLENISFTKFKSEAEVQEYNTLPTTLSELDPENQPILQPLDSIILLLLASSITNTSPADGLTREETLPYATRVLSGGSSNWQIYTQALLVRSRIEGYKSRTIERSVLQLQALVDQVLADTASSHAHTTANELTTFLPRPKEEESAPAAQRLRYVFQLCSPMRWELEAELAARWVSLGGLRTALEIYERLEMWPEVALCWAGSNREDKAQEIIRRQLFHTTSGQDENDDFDAEKWERDPRDPPPKEAPRLYCILGDLDTDPDMYETAWKVSNERYSRAQRSLGKYWYARNDYAKAALAYSKSVKIKQIDHPTWFALGCALLSLDRFRQAAEAFSRTVQLDDSDAEAWSNLATSLLHLEPDESLSHDTTLNFTEDDNTSAHIANDPQRHRRDALKALKQASRLQHTNHRIWDNLLTVSASLSPPSYTDMLTAQSHVISLRGAADGEKCIDVDVLSSLVSHVTTSYLASDSTGPGLPRMLAQLLDEKVVPLITSSAPLWRLVARMSLWRDQPGKALEAEERAWRVGVVQRAGWEVEGREAWDGVVEATENLVAAYESLGERVGEGGGEVCKDWKFKARSAVRSVRGRGKDVWEGSEGWDRLGDLLEGLKNMKQLSFERV